MHKKLLTIFSFLLLVLFFASIVNAQTTTGTDSAASKLKDQMRMIKDQKKETRVELRQQMKDTIQMKREETKAMVKTKRDEFKARIETIKDQKKKALVERIDTKLTNVNTKHTDRFTHVLSNLQIVLDKISEDVSKTQAQAAIDAAKLAVENQASKTYTITISAETALKSDVGTVTSQLRQDLSATHKAVVDAKQAVQSLRKDSAIMKKETTNLAN